VKVRVEKKIGDSILSMETGMLAKQAAGAVLISYNETVVLSTAATGKPRPGLDFFPLMCDYRERTCAAGKFPGGFIKREGRPTTKETLTSRLIDRPIRPMFAEGFKDEVQCQKLATFRHCHSKIQSHQHASPASTVNSLASQLMSSWKRVTWTSSFPVQKVP